MWHTHDEVLNKVAKAFMETEVLLRVKIETTSGKQDEFAKFYVRNWVRYLLISGVR